MRFTRPFLLAGLFVASLGAGALFAVSAPAEPPPVAPAAREITIVVDGGYDPARIVVTAGETIRLKFLRKDDAPCTREVVFPSLGIKRELPTNVPVVIDLPALEAGEITFTCGMNMLKGTIVVEPRKPR